MKQMISFLTAGVVILLAGIRVAAPYIAAMQGKQRIQKLDCIKKCSYFFMETKVIFHRILLICI